MRPIAFLVLLSLLCGCPAPPAEQAAPRLAQARLSLKDDTHLFELDKVMAAPDHLVLLGKLQGKERALEFFVPLKGKLEESLGKTLYIQARAPDDSDAHSYIRFPPEGQEVLLVQGGIFVILKVEDSWMEADLVLDTKNGPIEGTFNSFVAEESDAHKDRSTDHH